MVQQQKKRDAALRKELQAVQRQEARLAKAAMKAKEGGWKGGLESRIPAKVYEGLKSTFSKGFSLVFHQGRAIIEKGYSREKLQADHSIRDYAFQVRGRRKELKAIRKGAGKSSALNLAVTTAEGVALGLLGIGMPDIVLFLATLLKGIYETALNYGYDYEAREEQLLILKMMAAALSSGEDFVTRNREVDEMLILETVEVPQEEFDDQLKATASVFAMDMLLLKFIQGLPVVGILGGAANPVYYNKVLKYVQLKYRKRYLQDQGA